ncbi:hypothetical protein CCACVL1_03548, partial [Corchorus capsularis]
SIWINLEQGLIRDAMGRKEQGPN